MFAKIVDAIQGEPDTDSEVCSLSDETHPTIDKVVSRMYPCGAERFPLTTDYR